MMFELPSTPPVEAGPVQKHLWTAGGNLITARHSSGGAGVQSAGLSFGGYSMTAKTEEYN